MAVSIAVTLAVGAVLTRRSLDEDAPRSLDRQVELIAAQHAATPIAGAGRHRPLPRDRAGAARDPHPAAGRAAAPRQAPTRSADRRRPTAPSTCAGSRSCTRPGSGRRSPRPAALGAQPGGRLDAVSGRARARRAARRGARGGRRLRARPRRGAPVTRVAAASRRLAGGESPEAAPDRRARRRCASSPAAFNELTEELHRAQDAERAFLLSVSHELKTPLTAIRGHAEGLADGVIDPERAGGVIEREAKRLERLIRDLLDLARLRRRTFDVHARAVDLGEVAREAVAALRAAVAGLRRRSRASRSSRRRARSPTPGACCRRSRTSSRTRSVARRAAAPVGSSPQPGRLDVVDNGPGLAPDDLERAFERFYLWDRYGADRPVGTGLGLAIVAELAAAMGGRSTSRAARRRVGVHARLGPRPCRLPAYARLTQP